MPEPSTNPSALDRLLRFCLEQKLVVALLALLLIGWGIAVAPFDWEVGFLPREPVPVDAIPNLGENQQIVFTEWPGRSPQDIEDQVTYPLTVELMGLPGVREVRSQSAFGFSMIFVIFNDDIEFYWARARIIEKLNSLRADALPAGVSPALGPDATALGQIFWYTLEGRDPDGQPIGGWDPQELRAIQDWQVRYGLLSAEGIAEVASIGGFVPEYQVEADPDAMRAHGVTLAQVLGAVRKSNLDVGAGVTEINRVEYVIRGVGFIRELEDIELAVVEARDGGVPIRVKDVATVSRTPGPRRGALTVSGAEAVGGVTVVREGFNPLRAIHNVRQQIDVIRPGLPAKAVVDWSRIDRDGVRRFAAAQGFDAFASAEIDQDAWLTWLRHPDNPREQWPEWINLSQIEIVPFYDRTDLIYRTLGTLNDALVQQVLVTIIVVVLLVLHLRSALVISSMLPLAVLMAFIMMKLFGVDANVVALAGIAIAIGTIVDMGVIVTENVLKHLRDADPEEPRIEVVFRGTREVGSAILTAISTTIISFLPVFSMTGREGKMFVPLAYTKTFVLIASIFVALTIVPAAIHAFIAWRADPGAMRRSLLFGLGAAAVAVVALGIAQGWLWVWVAGLALLTVVLYHLLRDDLPGWAARTSPRWAGPTTRLAAALRLATPWVASGAAAVAVGWLLARVWEPLGPELGMLRNFLFVALLIGGLLALFALLMWLYAPILRLLLRHKAAFLSVPVLLVVLGLFVWLGFDARLTVPLIGEWLAKVAPWLTEISLVALIVLVLGALVALAAGYFVHDALRRRFGRGGSGVAAMISVIALLATASVAAAVQFQHDELRTTRLWAAAANQFPGLGQEFMPDLDEGSFLWMPSISAHGSIGEALEVLQYQDMAIAGVPEVEGVFGKIGRVESALDPAPVGMTETIVHYKSEYITDAAGRRVNFAYDRDRGEFLRDADGELIPDARGRPYRQWRDHIRSPADIWDEMVRAAELPGATGVIPLQPIETRLLMLQTGMRSSMGLKVRAGDLETLERIAVQLEGLLREMPAIDPATVNADRVVGKPYLEIHPDRSAIARYGLNIEDVHDVIAAAVGGTVVTTTVEGRERFPVRVRYPRELRQEIDQLERVSVPAADGTQIPLAQVAEIRYQRGPQMIKSEDTFLTAYVTFGAQRGMAGMEDMEGMDGMADMPGMPGMEGMAGHDHGAGTGGPGGLAEVEVVEQVRAHLNAMVKSGELIVPDGVSWDFAGTYEHYARAARTLRVVVPISLAIIFLILYFQFRSVPTTLIVFSGIAVAWAGGFVMIHLYAQPWFADFDLFGRNMRELFGMGPINLSVAVWVGFLALFGIAVDNGVVIATYLRQSFAREAPRSIEAARAAALHAGLRRVRPCLMTTATTILALLPILTSTGTGADIMIPMAIPSVGGMFFVLLTLFSVPVLYCLVEERRIRRAAA